MNRSFVNRAAVTITVSCLVTACAPSSGQEVPPRDRGAPSLQPDERVVYRQAGDRELELHVFRPSTSGSAAPAPAIVFFHGGGWTGGNAAQFYPQSRYFADLGMVVISVHYRTGAADGVPPNVCLMDAKSAMRWVRSHTAELGIDPDRIAAGGGSAGGHLAAALAVTDGFDHPDDDTSISTRPDALLLYNPVIDNGPDGVGYERVKEFWAAFSPLHNIKDDHPPTIFLLGTNDNLVPVSMGQAYKEAVEATGARMDLHLYEGAEHGFFNAPMPLYEDTNLKVYAFLRELGFLEDTPPQGP